MSVSAAVVANLTKRATAHKGKAVNLLKETIEAITASGHTPEQIIFIGSEESGYRCTWEDFQALADIEYDDGFGAQKVAADLIIVFSDGAKMWRYEYDGSEGWEYSSPFVMPTNLKPITRLVVQEDQVGWCSIEEIHTNR